MKSIKIFAAAGAIALLGMAGLSSCKTNNGPEGPGKYNGETVKTEFAISIPEAAGNTGGVKRMPSTTVQRDGATQFQGITGITLVPFAKQGTIAGGDARLGDNIELTVDVEATDINKPSHAKVYTDVSIPLTTSSFLFYAQSAATGTKFQVGSLIPGSLDATNPSSFTFDLEQILTANPLASGAGEHLLYYINTVAQANDGAGTPKAWYEYTDGDDAAMKAMFDTYSSMHGLSSFEVARVMTDLYNSLQPIDGSNALAHNIRLAINNGTYVSISGSGNECTVTMKDGYNQFPTEHGLPEGSIDIKWNSGTHAFVAGDYENMASFDKYVYPAQLWYFVNSQIRTSNTSKQTWYNNSNDWATILAGHEHAAPTGVNSLTRAVAIINPVQYAVARFDVLVQVASPGTALEDNSDIVEGSATNVNCSGGFPVTAVLVGGQKQVGWDFTPKGLTEYTIYDNIMTPSVETTPSTMMANVGNFNGGTNHTLVLESTHEADVNIAVELQNTTGKDFYGAGGQLIPAGGKFYVIAKLKYASTRPQDDIRTTGYVFKQDYTTTAKLTLTNLRSAYNTIPDLRTPQLELGFSVDLNWETGNTYDINFD